MTMTDPIADMLTRIRNANSVHHDKASRCDPRTSEIWSEQGTCYFRH